MCRQVLGVLGLLLVAAGPAAERTTAGESALITPQSIKGTGEYSNSPSLIIDGQTPAEEAAWNDDACVYWEKPQARFVITLDGVYQITGLAIQADNNDDYVIETSTDGRSFSPLLVVLGDWGGVFSGMQTLSTMEGDPHFAPEMKLSPAQAKYVRLSARNGDEAYGVSELSLYGHKAQPDSPGTVVVTGGDATTATAGGAIRPLSIKGSGEFSNQASLMIDGRTPAEEAAWNDDACVYWEKPQARFVITLDGVYQITGLTIQADNNDDYVVEVSTDGKSFSRLLAILGDWGGVFTGMQSLSTMEGDPHFAPEMKLSPVQAKYIRLSARNGDEAYSVSELTLYGNRVLSDSVPPTVVTGGDATTAQIQTVLLKAKSVKGTGEFSHAARLLIDQKMPKQETEYDNKSCVYWSDPETAFVVDLGEAFWISGLTIQVDNNDDYVIQVSLDGKVYKSLLTVRGEWGEVVDGMETLSTLAKDPQYLAQMTLQAAQARYVKLSAKGGDEAYSASELLLYGSKTAPAAAVRGVQPPAGTTPPSGGSLPPVTTPDSQGGPDSMEAVFDAIDKNKDGRISKEEYAAIWKDKLDVDKNFAFFDRDKSGYIEKQEFLSLADRVKDTGIAQPDTSGTTGTGGGQIIRLDPAKTQKAIDALPRWAEIRSLIPQGKTAEVNEIVKEVGFESWLELNRYFTTIYSVGMTVMNNPDGPRPYASRIGQESVDIIVRPENLERIKANAPTPPSR